LSVRGAAGADVSGATDGLAGARALVRPLVRLREGLQAVARGELDRPLPVESRDELGALARTFNWMLRQLAESREQLARQERELAGAKWPDRWRMRSKTRSRP
uniref:HAMP domain-containing protein n=1 Tax=Rhodothermus marinus TaxID=29549 RepID=UPI001FB2EC0C